jgi:hypothetical protein
MLSYMITIMANVRIYFVITSYLKRIIVIKKINANKRNGVIQNCGVEN